MCHVVHECPIHVVVVARRNQLCQQLHCNHRNHCQWIHRCTKSLVFVVVSFVAVVQCAVKSQHLKEMTVLLVNLLQRNRKFKSSVNDFKVFTRVLIVVTRNCCSRMCGALLCCRKKKPKEESRRTSMLSKKQSLAPTIPPPPEVSTFKLL